MSDQTAHPPRRRIRRPIIRRGRLTGGNDGTRRTSIMVYTVLHNGVPVGTVELPHQELSVGELRVLAGYAAVRPVVSAGSLALLSMFFPSGGHANRGRAGSGDAARGCRTALRSNRRPRAARAGGLRELDRNTGQGSRFRDREVSWCACRYPGRAKSKRPWRGRCCLSNLYAKRWQRRLSTVQRCRSGSWRSSCPISSYPSRRTWPSRRRGWRSRRCTRTIWLSFHRRTNGSWLSARVPAVDNLLSGFRDSYGRQVRPSALISRTGFSKLVERQPEPLLASAMQWRCHACFARGRERRQGMRPSDRFGATCSIYTRPRSTWKVGYIPIHRRRATHGRPIGAFTAHSRRSCRAALRDCSSTTRSTASWVPGGVATTSIAPGRRAITFSLSVVGGRLSGQLPGARVAALDS